MEQQREFERADAQNEESAAGTGSTGSAAGPAGDGTNARTAERRHPLNGVIDAGRNRIADQLEQIGDRIVSRAQDMEDPGAVARRAGQVAQRSSAALDSGADYIRTHEPAEMRDDLEEAIRARPLMSIGVAACAGFLLARMLGD